MPRASHVAHKRRVAWVSISMHTCGSVSIIMVLLASLRAAGAPLLRANWEQETMIVSCWELVLNPCRYVKDGMLMRFKVSSLVKSRQNTHSSVKYEVI